MRKSRLFLVGAIAAALTYGALFVAVGPRQWDYHGYHHHGWHHHHDHDGKSGIHQESKPSADEPWDQEQN